MIFDPRISEVFVKHIEGCNAADGSPKEKAAFKERDRLVNALGVEGRADMLVALNALRRLACRSDG